MSYNKKKKYLILIFVMATFIFSAIIGFTASKKQIDKKMMLVNQEIIKQMPTFTQEDNGDEYYLNMGEPFRIILPENPTTGYRWMVAQSTSPTIILLRQGYLPGQSDPSRMGAGGFRNMIFETTEKGPAELVLYLQRPWEAEEEYADFFTLSFEVN